MTFSPNLVMNKEQRSQKKRGLKTTRLISLKFGTGALIFSQEGRFETKYFQLVKKFLKKIIKTKTSFNYFYKRKCWVPIFSNFPLTKKSKNSRMGKGKGSFTRWVVRVKNGNKLIETKNISFYRLHCLKLLLQKHICVKISIFTKKSATTKIYFSSRTNYFWIL